LPHFRHNLPYSGHNGLNSWGCADNPQDVGNTCPENVMQINALQAFPQALSVLAFV
jgi:hypothetical protein